MEQLTSLTKPNFIGKDTFNWWVGQVEKSVDTAKNSNRVKVRIVGYHSDRNDVKAEDLPWAQILYPPTNSQMSGQGTKCMLLPGQWCLGLFLDGDEQQIPIVWGLLGGTSNTDDNSQVAAESFSNPQNIWKKPDYVMPENAGKKPGSPSADKTNDQPHLAPKAKEEDEIADGGGSPRKVAEDELGSQADQKRSADEAYKVNRGDGVCASEGMMDQMAAKLEEFSNKLANVTKAGENWIDERTGTVLDIQADVNTYSTVLSDMMKHPLSAIIRFTEQQIAKTYPGIYGAAANPKPSTLRGIKKTLDTALNTIKCIMETGLLEGLFPQFNDMLNGILDQVTSAPTKFFHQANCAIRKAMGDILNRALESVTNALNTVADLLLAIFSDLGSLLGTINGLISSVIGFAKSILGVLGCIDPDLIKCNRSFVYDTKQGFMRPQMPAIPSFGNTQTGAALEAAKAFMDNPIAADTLAEDGCADPDVGTYPSDNRQLLVPGYTSSPFNQALNPFIDQDELIEGFICSEVIDDVIQGNLDLVAVATDAIAAGQDPTILQTAQTAQLVLASGGGTEAQIYQASVLMRDLGILDNYQTCVAGEGPTYGINGTALGWNPSDREILIGQLDAPLIDGTWVRYKRDRRKNMKIASSWFIPRSGDLGGSGANILLPIDGDGYPAQDGIVIDGGSGYGNGANGACAPDLFVVTPMYDPNTGFEVDGHFLKGTAFVNVNGEIVAASFENTEGYIFRDKPVVSVNMCGGEFRQPDVRDAVNDPNTLTSQTDTTVVISAESPDVTGILFDIVMRNVGAGYIDPVAEISGGCFGYGAAAVVEHSQGRITAIKLTDSGIDYNCIPQVIIRDNVVGTGNRIGGKGAKAVARVRFVNRNNRSLQEKLAQRQPVQVVDCP